MNQVILNIPQISLNLASWLVPGIAPPGTHPASATPGTPLPPASARPWLTDAGRWSKYGRGAHIRRSTHLAGTLVAVWDYDRGI